MTLTKEMQKIQMKIAETKEVFIVEELMMNHMTQNTDGTYDWKSHVRIRLKELEDYKAEVKEAIEKCSYHNGIFTMIINEDDLFKELGL